MKIADMYLKGLYDAHVASSERDDRSIRFQCAHAEGACAVLRDLGMLSGEGDLTWRRKFRDLQRQRLDDQA